MWRGALARSQERRRRDGLPSVAWRHPREPGHPSV